MKDKFKFAVVDTSPNRIPQFKETLNARGYVNYGPDNMTPDFYRMLSTESATLHSVIQATVTYICGNGVVAGEKADRWKDRVNRKGQTLNDLVSCLAQDYLTYGGYAFQIIYSKLLTVAELIPLPFGNTRVSENGEKVYYCQKWGVYTNKTVKEYDAYNREKIDPENPTQIYWFKGNARTYYPLPPYFGAQRDCLAEIEASKLQLNELSNGLAPKSIITFGNASMMTDDEKRDIEKAIREKFTGTEASTFMVYFNEEGQADLRVDSIKTENDTERFIKLKESTQENIFTAMRCPPQLLGKYPNDGNKGFSKVEYLECFEIYNRTVVKGYQTTLLRSLREVLATPDIKILPFSLDQQEE